MSEEKTYIGVKLIKAKPINRIDYNKFRGWKLHDDENGADEGYMVTYPDSDNYVSWSPKEIFDKSYFQLEDESKISHNDVVGFIDPVGQISTVDEKTTLLRKDTITGFRFYETSSCVDPKNYDENLGTKICDEKIIDKMWGHLGFVLQWAKNGLTNE
jgi:hypothetical protein|uniref:Uncharacterized protein n=1 Tax=uncultured marine virus TaxID=186617 RepID=A0A0F7L2F2_9VIRU|nr:hypothetical protein B739_1374 [uncultured marine virus]